MDIHELVESRSLPGEEHYLTPGRHIQLIGSQSGGFKAFGHHVPNEMGGIWMHPIKLLDGFWFGIVSDDDNIEWLTDAVRYSNHAFYNVLEFESKGFDLERTEYSAQTFAGLVVDFAVTSTAVEASSLRCVVSVRSDLQPVWYSETAGIVDGPDRSWDDGRDFLAKDQDHDWFTRCRLDGVDVELFLPDMGATGDEVFGTGSSGTWYFPIELTPGESRTVTLKITGSLKSAAETLERMESLARPASLFQEKGDYYNDILSRTDVELPDKDLEKQYAWSKCHVEWLTICSEPVGTGLAAGMPEYPWWFGVDSAYALKGCLPAGFHELAEQTLAIIHQGSQRANGNGRIIHEQNSYGVVGNPGNTQETALFIHALYETYRWTGNKEWITSYWPAIRMSVHYLLDDQMDAGHFFPNGSGVIEGRGLTGEVIDTAVYTQVALENASEVALVVGDDYAAANYSGRAMDLAEKIRTVMWLDDEGLFADVRTTGKELISIIDHLINRSHLSDQTLLVNSYSNLRSTFAESHPNLDDRIPFCLKNWVIDTPIEMGIATKEQAALALARLNSPEFVGTWGMYLSGNGLDATMTISTATLINGNLAYGNADEALDLIHRVTSTFNMYLPGSMSEMSPDYGCFVQAWTAYATISPMITGFLGLQPDAGKKALHVEPCLPSSWEFIKLDNVRIGPDSFGFELRRTADDRYSLTVRSGVDDWTISAGENTMLIRS